MCPPLESLTTHQPPRFKVPTTKEGLPKAYASGYKTKDFVLPVVEVNTTKVEQYAQVGGYI